MQIRSVPADQSPAVDLIEAMIQDLVPLYGRIDGPGTPPAGAQEMGPPGGTFLVIYRDGEPIAGGGVKRLSEDTAEIKRMYVVPQARGQGVARTLLVALEDAARDLGYAKVRLDTGPDQPHARRLYESAGTCRSPTTTPTRTRTTGPRSGWPDRATLITCASESRLALSRRRS